MDQVDQAKANHRKELASLEATIERLKREAGQESSSAAALRDKAIASAVAEERALHAAKLVAERRGSESSLVAERASVKKELLAHHQRDIDALKKQLQEAHRDAAEKASAMAASQREMEGGLEASRRLEAELEGERGANEELQREAEAAQRELLEMEMLRGDHQRGKEDAARTAEELTRTQKELEAAQCEVCEVEFLRQGVRELEATNKSTLAEMRRLEKQLAETQAEADAGLDQSIKNTGMEAELEAALRQVNVLQSSLEREAALRRKTSEIDRAHIGDLEQKLKKVEATVGPRDGKPVRRAGSSKPNAGKHDQSAYKEALAEAAMDIRGKLQRVDNLRQEAAQSGLEINRVQKLLGTGVTEKSSPRGGQESKTDPVELNRQIESLNAELNKQHKFTAEVASELKDTKRHLAVAQEQSEGYRATLQAHGLLHGEGQERFRETLTRARRERNSPKPPPVFDPEDLRTDRTPKPLTSLSDKLGKSAELVGSDKTASWSKAELRERLTERGRLQKPRNFNEWEQGGRGASKPARFF